MTIDIKSRMSEGSLVFLISALIALSAIPLDVMLPSFPSLAYYFSIDVKEISLSIAFFSVGFAVAQLFVGPLSDRYGRKFFLITGLILAISGSAGCILSSDYSLFLGFRVIQSIGCACFVLAQAIIQDLFKEKKGHFLRIYATTFGGVCIACSPLIGTALQNSLGWRGSFLLFILLSFLILIQTVFFFTESAARSHIGALSHLCAYKIIFFNKLFISYSLIGALTFACHFSFIIASPMIFLIRLKMTSYEYSFILLFYGTAYVIGGIIATYVSKRLDSHKQIGWGLILLTASALTMWLLLLIEGRPIITVLVPMLICTAGTILIRPAVATEAMTLFDNLAGTAAAAAGTIRFGAGGLIAAAVSAIGTDITINLLVMIISTTAFCSIIFRFLSARPRVLPV